MTRPLFTSVDEMLVPAVLSALESRSVHSIRRVPVRQAEANSGSRFYQVETNNGTGPRYILKRTEPSPYLPPSYNDPNRSVAVWQHDILDRLPPAIEHAMVACSHDGAGYAILMRDVSETLMPGDRGFSSVDHARFLDTMATMHAIFWEDPHLKSSPLASGDPAYLLLEPGAEGWAFVEKFLVTDVAQVVRSLLVDPRPLYKALMQYPATLVHNDLWWANLGIIRSEVMRVVILDWDFASLAPPAVDLAHYIGENAGLLPDSDQAIVAAYRALLAQRLGSRFDDRWWLPQLELCVLGDFLRRGKWLLRGIAQMTDEHEHAQCLNRLAWWSNAIRLGARWLRKD
jgi:hypothetical protein